MPATVSLERDVANASVLDTDQAVGAVDDLAVVGGEDECSAETPVDVAHQRQDSFAGLVIEIRSGLIGQDDVRLSDQGARDGNPLALPAAQLIRAMTRELGELHDVEKVGNAPAPFGRVQLFHLQQGILDVLLGSENRE